jgi:hypothetical protein
MRVSRDRKELIGEIARALQPSMPRQACETRLNQLIGRREEQFCLQTGIAPPGLNRTLASLASARGTARVIRDAYFDLSNGLKQVARAREKLIGAGEPVALNFSFIVCRLEDDARRALDAAKQVKVRSVRSDAFPKELCAYYALDLMLELSSRMPSAAGDGPYQKISSLLWELLTGEVEKNLDRQCRNHIKKLRPPGSFWSKAPPEEFLIERKRAAQARREQVRMLAKDKATSAKRREIEAAFRTAYAKAYPEQGKTTVKRKRPSK